jgi:hypothetical protein
MDYVDKSAILYNSKKYEAALHTYNRAIDLEMQEGQVTKSRQEAIDALKKKYPIHLNHAGEYTF